MPPKYHNEDWLNREYHGKNRTLTDMGEECGVYPSTIADWMERYGIERREKWAQFNPAHFRTGTKGYERWETEHHVVSVHRLMAVAKWGFSAVVGNDVHHKNGVPWDNRFDNLGLMSHSEHMRHHYPNGPPVKPDHFPDDWKPPA